MRPLRLSSSLYAADCEDSQRCRCPKHLVSIVLFHDSFLFERRLALTRTNDAFTAPVDPVVQFGLRS